MSKARSGELIILAAAIALFAIAPVASSPTREEREQRQYELDAACEVARQEKLIPLRAKFVQECVEEKQRPDRAACERFYADYGNQSGSRAALFYDLPECQAAFQYRQSYRSTDR